MKISRVSLSLRIYVPSESLSELPLKEIKHRLSDVTFKRIKKSGEVSNSMSRKVSSICVCNFRLPRIRTIDYFTKYEVKKMDKQLYYRIMVPASLLSVCLFCS